MINTLKIIRYIDYCWLNNFVANSIEPIDFDKNQNYQIDYEWNLFSNNQTQKQTNIYEFIKFIKKNSEYSNEVLLLSINVFEKICIKYAHLIENYTFLFAAVYIAINKSFVEGNLDLETLTSFFHIEKNIAKKMIFCINKFIQYNNVQISLNERLKLLDKIIYN